MVYEYIYKEGSIAEVNVFPLINPCGYKKKIHHASTNYKTYGTNGKDQWGKIIKNSLIKIHHGKNCDYKDIFLKYPSIKNKITLPTNVRLLDFSSAILNIGKQLFYIYIFQGT